MSMALSFCTNWPSQDTAYSSLFRPPSPELPPELFAFHEDSTFYDTCINTLFDPNNNIECPSLLSSTYPSVVPVPFTPTGNVFMPSPELQVPSFIHEDPYHQFPYSATFDHGHFFVEHPMATQLQSELPPLPEIYLGGGCADPLIPYYDYGRGHRNYIDQTVESSIVQVKKQNPVNGGGSLSAQSVAARVRRRKISEKTQELGKLIPGGHKMNTAEMFQAAFKYIKFLQAQVGVLKLMASVPENEEVLGNGETQALLTCTLMQEKLYTAEKCIVPKHLAETLADEHQLQTNN